MKTFLPLLLALAPAAAFACGAPPGFDTPPADATALVDAGTAGADAAPAAANDTVAIHASDAARGDDRRCIRATGTRLAARDEDGCTALPGESYDRDDIDRTGAVDTADAIRRLSPSATLGH